jgi:hypothetical protein
MNWISSKDSICKFIREKTVENMPVTDMWKDYLCNRSGSITEYYQLYKGCEKIEEYTESHQINYDLFIRTRCDILIPNPLLFDTFLYSPSEISERFQAIRQTIQQTLPTISIAHCIAFYIASISQPLEYALKRITTPHFTLESIFNNTSSLFNIYEKFLNPKHPENALLTKEDIANFIEMVIPDTRITYRQNLFYMGFIRNGITEKNIILNYYNMDEKRTKHIYCAKELKSIFNERLFWFNAENIFQKFLTLHSFILINSFTQDEENSLYHKENITHLFHPHNIFLLIR